MATIKREAGDKIKGFTLQKQRAIGLFFDAIKANSNAHINVAIEYKGDVYLQNEEEGYVEEQKNYDADSRFSFNSAQILNTLAYFLEIWFKENKSSNIKFGFYSTNNISKESNTTNTANLGITLPNKAILDLLIAKQYLESNLMPAIWIYLKNEYSVQYGKDISTLTSVEEIEGFLDLIDWNFAQDNEKNYESEIIQKIKVSEFSHLLKSPYHAEIAYASLMYALESRQDVSDALEKLLSKHAVENIFLKINYSDKIDPAINKYLNFDLSELNVKVKQYLKLFLENKYFANIKNKEFPELIGRKVAKHDRQVKTETKDLQQSNPDFARLLQVVIKEIGDFINSNRPTFLFGEMGSGKSTLLAHYYYENGENAIFLPTYFLKGKVGNELKIFKDLVNQFVNNELQLNAKGFDLDLILTSNAELVLIIDGLDELDNIETKLVLQHLISLAEIPNLRIIASARPIEVEQLVDFNKWNCLTTLDLTEQEIKKILLNEALASGLDSQASILDAGLRYDILKSKSELLTSANTPLSICLIRDFLTAEIGNKTLGDILFDIIKKRLTWTEDDKKNSFEHFTTHFPHPVQRESILSAIANKIYLSSTGKINDDQLFEILNSEDVIPATTTDRNKVVADSIIFFKNIFLQKSHEGYGFQSHQLYQVAVGLAIFSTINRGQQFGFKNTLIDEWRLISFASTIARRKGETDKIITFLEMVVKELMKIRENTPATAVLLAEAQIKSLDTLFLDLLKTLGFRPLMFWGNTDTLVTNSYAYIFNSIGQDGFNWLFKNYISPLYPSRIGIDELPIAILRNYLVLQKYSLNTQQEQQLSSIVPIFIKTYSYACTTWLPVIVLAIPEAFELRNRCILLAQSLENLTTSQRAETLLSKEFSDGNEKSVLNALEMVCLKKEQTKPITLSVLLKLTKGEISQTLLDEAIETISKGQYEVYDTLIQHFDKDALKSYLRYSVLHKTPFSSSAAFLLFKYFDERNIAFIGEPLLIKTPWFDYRHLEKEKILDELIVNDPKGFDFIIHNQPPIHDTFGLPELYIKYFLKAIIATDKIFVAEFRLLIKNLGKFSLTRYPEIRDLFKAALKKTEYYEAVVLLLKHIDSIWRFYAASVLVVAYPESEFNALQLIIRSAFQRSSDTKEFLRLCMKLNYSYQILEKVHELLTDLPEVPKIFAMKILFHSGIYKLTQSETDELLDGLSGKASFLDWSETITDDGIEPVAANAAFFNKLIERLNSDDLNYAQVAASNLIYHHYTRLSIEQVAKAWLFYIHQYDSGLLDFHRKHQLLMGDSQFTDALVTVIDEKRHLIGGKSFLFELYRDVVLSSTNFEAFFEMLIMTNRGFARDNIEYMFELFIDIGKSSPKSGQELGRTVAKIMDLPAYSENKTDNILLPEMTVLAHEFGTIDEGKLNKVVNEYRISKDKVAASLLYRLGNIPTAYRPNRIYKGHILIFTDYDSITAPQFEKTDAAKFLVDAEDIPDRFLQFIIWSLITKAFTKEELLQLSSMGNLAKFFMLDVLFCSGEELTPEMFNDVNDIGSLKHYMRAKTQYLKSVIYKIKEIIISDPQERPIYQAALIASIDENDANEVVDIYTELISLGFQLESDHIAGLFNALMEIPYRLNTKLMHELFSQILRDEIADKEKLVNSLAMTLKSTLSITSEYHDGKLDSIAWMISLIILYLEGKLTEAAESGFLSGLRSFFIQDGADYVGEKNLIKFKALDVLMSSQIILSKIKKEHLKSIVEKGIDSEDVEISTVCRLFQLFN